MDDRAFPETHWSQLLTLRNPAHPKHAEHLERLVRLYWSPAYHYLRSLRGVSAGDAEDLTQQFFTLLLSRGSLRRLDPDRGSFRGFLKTALRRFAVDAERREAARSPRGGARLFRFEEAEALWRQGRSRDAAGSPEDAFDREWARSVLERAVERLKEELQGRGKAADFELFRRYCLEPEGEALSYEALARERKCSVDDVRNALRAVRRRGREILEDLLRDYLFPGERLEDEIRFILSR
ncbi:MAG TPA: sigma factor [Planctomycetota bacterium]|jgi:RNA polymerase sigma-70 factor (ECF subfamily)|nr:sigma factor [Planctomycetota bacterium]